MFSKLLDILESDVAALPEKDMAIMVMDQFLHKNPEIRNHGLRAIQALYNLGQPQEHLHLEEARKSVVRHFFPAHYRLEGGDVGWCPRRYEGKEELFTVNAESAMSEAQSALKHILGGGLEPNTYEYCERILERIRHVLLNNDTPKYPHALEECVYQFLDSGDGYIAAAARRACAAITIAYRQLEAEERLWEQLERGETEPYDLEEWIASKRMLNRSAYDLAKKTLELAAQNKLNEQNRKHFLFCTMLLRSQGGLLPTQELDDTIEVLERRFESEFSQYFADHYEFAKRHKCLEDQRALYLINAWGELIRPLFWLADSRQHCNVSAALPEKVALPTALRRLFEEIQALGMPVEEWKAMEPTRWLQNLAIRRGAEGAFDQETGAFIFFSYDENEEGWVQVTLSEIDSILKSPQPQVMLLPFSRQPMS
ncbi:MAG: hypothetical protein KDB07_12830 [Planctomycetes bacterium]|nr:hypothetical protein [Planctomycetota bacterium]